LQNSKCEPCPAVKCALFCKYGFARDPKTGCPDCTCNPAPTCPVATTNADITAICPLDCANTGFYYDKEGCPHCTCNVVKPCECGPFPTNDKPLLCADGKSYSKLTDVCARSATNVCSYVRTKCPYIFEVIVKAGSPPLTENDIAKIKASIGVSDANVEITKSTQSNGDIKYTIFVQKDSLPEGKTATDVNTEIDTTVKTSNSGAASFIVSDGSVTPSFAMNLVPMVGLFLAVLFI